MPPPAPRLTPTVHDPPVAHVSAVTVNVTSTEPVKYVLVVAAVARTTQLPAALKVSCLVEESMAQPVVPALETA
jgi:hypothetical protein